MSTLFAILSSLIRIYTICHFFLTVLFRCTLFAILSRLITGCTVCHSQSDQYQHYLPFSAVWSGSTLLPFFLSIIMKVYTVCHSQQSNQGLHYLSFTAVWSESPLFAILSLISVYTICHSFLAVWSRSILFAILSILIRVYTTCHSQHSDQGIHYLQF